VPFGIFALTVAITATDLTEKEYPMKNRFMTIILTGLVAGSMLSSPAMAQTTFNHDHGRAVAQHRAEHRDMKHERRHDRRHDRREHRHDRHDRHDHRM